MLREGSEIRGTWRIRQEIGRGGMSVVSVSYTHLFRTGRVLEPGRFRTG